MDRRDQLLDRVRASLACPSCRGALVEDRFARTSLRCPACGLTARRSDGAFHFQGLSAETQQRDWLNGIKAKAKQTFGRWYPLAKDVLGPVYGDSGIDAFLASFATDALVVDLGSGTSVYADHVVAVDGYAYDNVHVVCDLAALPFADGAVDGIVSQGVLEHVPDPVAHVAEMLHR